MSRSYNNAHKIYKTEKSKQNAWSWARMNKETILLEELFAISPDEPELYEINQRGREARLANQFLQEA